MPIVAGQAALNIFLASWLYVEYVHNVFMQNYMAKFWSANAAAVSIGIIAAGAIAGGSILAFARRGIRGDSLKASQLEQTESTVTLAALDICPFCNTALVTLSENRFQCRRCRRYFKK